MALLFLGSLLISSILAVAQSTLTPTILCIPGQCLQGYSNVTLGAILSSPVSPVPLHLLPGQYTATTNPQLLHNALTSSSSTLAPSSGLGNGSLALPLDLSLLPGLAVFTDRLYAGQTAFTNLPTSPPNPNSSTPLAANSMMLSSDIVVIASSSSNRVVLWDSVPDTQHLPSPLNSALLSLVDIQSTTCSPACSSGGVCNPSGGQCVCLDGFTGQSCESCATGRFGPQCQQCPSNCDQCDDGISGTGRCLKPSGGGNNCNCLNGVCGSDGNCQCNAGFVTAANGTQCAKCADGFFLTSNGDCKVCQVGCTQCADITGDCVTCQSGFSQDPTDRTQCDPALQFTSTGIQCPLLGFASGSSCLPCAPTCASCNGESSNNCTECLQGLYMLNGVCVPANGEGNCQGTSLLADNNKKACDSCGAKCTGCKVPNFSIASLASQFQCTGCIPGSFLSNGTCVDSCPSGTFVSPQDNMTCLPCDSSCSTCSGSATFCLTCSSQNQLSSNGQCVAASSCPKNTFPNPSTSSCLSCHPDCETCSGSSFNQCTACPSTRPVLSNGRCMPTCSKNEFWDSSSNSCKTCDSSCGSCTGPGSSSCLSCTNANNLVLRSGSCVASSGACASSNTNLTTVVNPLGACLSELLLVPNPSQTSGLPPMPTVTGLDQPTIVVTRGRRLEWWQILLMALGCAFIFVAVVWCCRRRMRKKKREEKRRMQAYAFANVHDSKKPWWKRGGKRKKNGQPYHPDLDDEVVRTGPSRTKDKHGWKWSLIRFGEKFFGHSKSTRVYPASSSRATEMERTTRDGKPIVVLSDLGRRYDSDTKYKHRYRESSPLHSRSSSESNSIPNHFRDDSDSDHSITRPAHPKKSSDKRILVDVRSFEGRYLDSKETSSRRPRWVEDDAEEEEDMIKLISSYRNNSVKKPAATRINHLHHGSREGSPSPSNSSRTRLLARRPSPRPYRDEEDRDSGEHYRDDVEEEDYRHSRSSLSTTESMYSQVTGHARRMPNVRQPVRNGNSGGDVPVLKSKFSMSTVGADISRREGNGKLRKDRG